MTKRLLSIYILFILLVSFATIPIAFAKDYVVPISMARVDSTTFPGITSGDRLLINSGNRGPLTIQNISGSVGNPIIVINSGGRVNIDASWVGIYFRNCEHIKLTGSGVGNITYGFLISNGTNQGILAEAKTDEIEREYIEITKVHIGITAKTIKDIYGQLVARTWIQYNTTIHNCYIHDVEGEGIYIGSSYYKKNTEPLLKGVYIHHNILKNIDFDGIQVGSAVENVEVYNNTIIDAGLSDGGDAPNGANSQAGIVINNGSVGSYYNNRIENPRHNGVIAVGLGNYNFFDNIIVNAGNGNFGGNGIKILKGFNSNIKGNKIVDTEENGIYIESYINSGTIFNNTILGFGSNAIKANGLPAENIYNNEISSVYRQSSLTPPAGLKLSVSF